MDFFFFENYKQFFAHKSIENKFIKSIVQIELNQMVQINNDLKKYKTRHKNVF